MTWTMRDLDALLERARRGQLGNGVDGARRSRGLEAALATTREALTTELARAGLLATLPVDDDEDDDEPIDDDSDDLDDDDDEPEEPEEEPMLKKRETKFGNDAMAMTVEHPPYEAAAHEYVMRPRETPREATRASIAKVVGIRPEDAAYIDDAPLLAMGRAVLSARKGAR